MDWVPERIAGDIESGVAQLGGMYAAVFALSGLVVVTVKDLVLSLWRGLHHKGTEATKQDK